MALRFGGFSCAHIKTKWGSCNHHRGTIRLNTELAKKPRQCLEYLIVHELVHLLEPTHNARFISLMGPFFAKLAILQTSAQPIAAATRAVGVLATAVLVMALTGRLIEAGAAP